MDPARPSRLPPPGSTGQQGTQSRPQRPAPPPEANSSYSKFDELTDQQLPTDSSPNLLAYSTELGRVQFSAPLESSRSNLLPVSSADGGFSGAVARKRSLVRPDRERMDENHRLFNYRNHAAAMEAEGRGVAGISRTGHYATAGLARDTIVPNSAFQDATNLRRGKSILAREEGEAHETGLSMFKRGATLRRPNNPRAGSSTIAMPGGAYEKGRAAKAKAKREPLGPWMIFCLALTICCPSPLLKSFGLRTKERQSAWREKMGLLAVIGLSMAAVGFLTFGFTSSVCGTPGLRYKSGDIDTGSLIFHGYNYDFDKYAHPAAAGIAGGSNPLYNLFGAASMDASFLFQTVNQRCLNIITPAVGTGIPTQGESLGWYFPCNLYNQWGSSAINKTGYTEGVLCHTQNDARSQFSALKPLGQVYFNWSDLKNETRNLGVYDGAVLDFSLLNWLDKSQVNYPALFDEIKTGNASYRARDITAMIVATNQRAVAECLVDTIRVGFIDSVSIGCVASDIVLYISLTVIIGVVFLRFVMAVLFGWFLSWRIGKFPEETSEQRATRAAEIEHWTDDIYRPAPAKYRPNVKNGRKMLPKTSRFSKSDLLKPSSMGAGNGTPSRPESKFGDYRKSMAPSMYGSKSMLGAGMRNSPPGSPGGGRSSTSLPMGSSTYNIENQSVNEGIMGACPFPPCDVVPQPPADFEPFNYPLAHTILLVTAYSESFEGLRTTLDSLATTDYPNSHKVILVIADGMVKGSENSLTTPELVLGMMKDLVVPSDDVEALSYVAIADGHKRHNRAKIFAGFYEYDNNTVELGKQQRVSMLLVAKVGNASEAKDAKPGNRGKRDSQIILMSFLQKVMFDERMTLLEYEFFNSLWRCTGVSPDKYEMVLMVDADTKVFPDSASRMVSCMVHDPEIMGLCGETKIANKGDSWVTMIQVFEYYAAQQLVKAAESVFGSVTCLPGCFSMYRLKAPKGDDGYWVPILANPDIVEHYSENVVDTLHKKNLLLLGEDRYLTTLMLRTFPRRKMIFCPQAVCKTVVPDTFRVLLSQRRRWINSTIHNLFELFLVPDLCGVFCFSMKFVVFMELAGTIVLPAAISFTLYLIIVAIIPGTVKPVLPLILLAIILGLPAFLIVMTTRKVAYLGWMFIYLLSLPIWSGVLPLYAFMHMDDFSWGETRKVAGQGKDEGHTDKDGEFDSSEIVMKRWADFERDRRYKLGAHSRDSTYNVIHRTTSPERSSNRYSTVSSVDTFLSNGGSAFVGDGLLRKGSPGISTSHSTEGSYAGPRYPQQLELPAPLGGQASGMSAASSLTSVHRYTPSSTPELPSSPFEESMRYPSDPSLPIVPRQTLGTHDYTYPRYAEGYDSDEVEREAILSDGGSSKPHSPRPDVPYSRPARERPSSRQDLDSLVSPLTSTLDHTVTSTPSSPEISTNPFSTYATNARKLRGVSLVDSGPVPGTEGVRVAQRSRRTSQGPSSGQSPTHRNRNSIQSPSSPTDTFAPPLPMTGGLPPGAAPPQSRQG